MIRCTKCGTINADTDIFCSKCASFLEWTGVKVDPQSADQPATADAPLGSAPEPRSDAPVPPPPPSAPSPPPLPPPTLTPAPTAPPPPSDASGPFGSAPPPPTRRPQCHRHSSSRRSLCPGRHPFRQSPATGSRPLQRRSRRSPGQRQNHRSFRRLTSRRRSSQLPRLRRRSHQRDRRRRSRLTSRSRENPLSRNLSRGTSPSNASRWPKSNPSNPAISSAGCAAPATQLTGVFAGAAAIASRRPPSPSPSASRGIGASLGVAHPRRTRRATVRYRSARREGRPVGSSGAPSFWSWSSSSSRRWSATSSFRASTTGSTRSLARARPVRFCSNIPDQRAGQGCRHLLAGRPGPGPNHRYGQLRPNDRPAGLIFNIGAPASDYATYGRPREVQVTFPGVPTPVSMLLDDSPAPQQRCLQQHASVRTLNVRIVSSYPPSGANQNLVATREIEFIAGNCP